VILKEAYYPFLSKSRISVSNTSCAEGDDGAFGLAFNTPVTARWYVYIVVIPTDQQPSIACRTHI